MEKILKLPKKMPSVLWIKFMRHLQINAHSGADLLKAEYGLPRGSIYTTLARMEKANLVRSQKKWDSGGPRRLYRLTPYGKRMLRAMEAFEEALFPRDL